MKPISPRTAMARRKKPLHTPRTIETFMKLAQQLVNEGWQRVDFKALYRRQSPSDLEVSLWAGFFGS